MFVHHAAYLLLVRLFKLLWWPLGEQQDNIDQINSDITLAAKVLVEVVEEGAGRGHNY